MVEVKVAMLSRDGPKAVGGIVTVTSNLVRELKPLGVDVDWRDGRGRAWRTYALPLARNFPDVDLVHIQGSPYGPWAQRPYVVTVHALLAEEMKYRSGLRKLAHWIGRRSLEKRTLNNAAKVIAVSEATKSSILEHTEVSSGRISVVPNGVDLERFRPLKHSGTWVSWCGRTLDPRKNFADWWSLYLLLKPKANFRWFDGSVPQEVVLGGMGITDVFVSTSYSEGFDLALLEAMASGAACVVSDIPAHRELGDGCVSYYRPGDTDALKDKVEWLIDDKENRVEMGHRARGRAKLYPWSKTAEMTKAVYKEVLED